jgi:hypothetical protein
MTNKLSLLLTLLAFSFGVLSSLAQVDLNQKISIELHDKPIKQILKTLEQENNFYFAYNPDDLGIEKNITIKQKKASIKNVLNEVLESRFTYKSIGNHIILNLKDQVSTIQTYTIRGTVHNTNNIPLDSVIIYALKDKRAVISREDGTYTINLKTRPQYINISRPHFKDTLILAEDITNGIVIYLQPQLLVKKIEPAQLQSIETNFEDLNLVKSLIPQQSVYVAQQIKVRDFRPVQFSFIPGFGTNNFCSGLQNNNFSLNLLAGYSNGLRGLEIGGLANIIHENMNGTQLSGIANIVNGNTNGLQIAGIVNYNFDILRGAQIGGIANITHDKTKGFQFGGIFNMNKGDMSGIQVSGIVNINTDHVYGMQLAGITNTCKETVTGAQVAGITNVCSNDVKGLQISGLLNKTKILSGVQVGLVNIADSVEAGLQLGLFNIVKNGYRAFELTSDETYAFDLYYKTGGKKLYSLINIGIDQQKVGGGYGIGLIQPLFTKLSVSIDGVSTAMLSTDAENVYQGQKSSARLAINYDFLKYFGITTGVSFNYFEPYNDNKESAASERWAFQSDSSNILSQSVQNNQNAKWIGWFIGIRL